MPDDQLLKTPQSRIERLMTHRGISRDIIVDQPAIIDQIAGQFGLLLEIRLPSYRSLPLSCIEKIGVKIDGAAVDLSAALLRIEGNWYQLSSLPSLLDVWWFILDTATLLVPGVAAAGRHEVAVEIVRVEPYITAGRFSFIDVSTASVFVKEPADA